MICVRCSRLITAADQRTRLERGDRDEPSYWEPACRHCAPSEDDDARARDAYDERRFSAFRDGAEGDGH